MKVSTVFIKTKRKKSKSNFPDAPLILSAATILTGLISGTLIYCFMKETLTANVLKLFFSFFYDFSSKSNSEALSGLLISAVPYIFIMLVLALDLIGAPLSLLFTYFKTLAPTLLFSFMYREYGIKGAEYVFLILAAGEIVLLFGVLLICSSTYRMSRSLFNFHKGIKGEYPQKIRSFITEFTMGTVIIIFSRFVTFLTVIVFKGLFVF